MPQFSYRARNAQGGLVEGVLNVADRSVAIRQIEQLHYIPIRIEAMAAETASPDGTAAPRERGGDAKSEDSAQPIADLYRTARPPLAQAGMTLDEGLGVLEKRLKHPRVQQMTHALHQALVDGRSFSQALRDFPRIFPTIYVNLVAAGEASGALPDILTRLVEHLMQAKNLRDRVQQALIYPAFLAVAGSALITIFITFMVPQLTDFMAQNGGTLPLPTRILLGANHVITGYWWLFILVVLGVMVGFRAFVRTDEGRMTWDRFRLTYSGLRPHHSPPLLRPIFAHARHLDGKRDPVAQSARSGDGNRGQQVSRGKTARRAPGGHRWRESLERAAAEKNFFRSCLPT